MPETTVHDLPPEELGRLARALMRRQARLSLGVAAVFAVLLLGLPLVNTALPASGPGLAASWLVLGVLIYPVAVGLSVLFVRRSDRIEAECADWKSVLDREARR